jgi:hypothetical protein
MAYVMPLMVWAVNETGLPLKVILLSAPVGPVTGNIARKFLAPVACVTLKLSVLPLHANDPKEELFRPSSHVNICNEDTIGTPFVCAEVTTSGAIPG